MVHAHVGHHITLVLFALIVLCQARVAKVVESSRHISTCVEIW